MESVAPLSEGVIAGAAAGLVCEETGIAIVRRVKAAA
jgi:hypothetical protein